MTNPQVQSQTIESLDLSVEKILSDFYVVPSYQREYVWDEEQVEQLMNDVYEAFPDLPGLPTAEYFIGSIVVTPGAEGVFELIDGQQRMTTIFLFVCAMRDRLQGLGVETITHLSKQIASTSMSELGLEILRYRVSLQYEDSANVLEHVARGDAFEDLDLPRTRSVENIQRAYEAIMAFLRTSFDEDADELRRFYAYFINRVKLVRIRTESVAHALKVFETVNDRGVGLDSMDLLKNLMFMRAERVEFDRLKEIWKDLIDTLFEAGEKPLRFLRYFIFANFKVDRLKEDQIYRWFSDNEAACGYGEDPLGFAKRLRQSGKHYARFTKSKNVDGTDNRYLSNIYSLSYAARQQYILLLAASHLAVADFIELSRQLENLFFAYIITREPTKEFERRFAQWAPYLRKCRTRGELQAFLDEYFDPARRRLTTRYELAFQELHEYQVPKYRMRYIIGKLAQYVNEQAYGATEADLTKFLSTRDVEHILSQTPSDVEVATFTHPEDTELADYIPMLGNMTLLEHSINRSIGNRPFVEKLEGYRQSHFLLTRSIAQPIRLGATQIDRAVDGLETFAAWNAGAVERRQAILTELARRVWDMPA